MFPVLFSPNEPEYFLGFFYLPDPDPKHCFNSRNCRARVAPSKRGGLRLRNTILKMDVCAGADGVLQGPGEASPQVRLPDPVGHPPVLQQPANTRRCYNTSW